MQFCPKCGAILMLKTKNYGCPRCNYTTNEKIKIETKEKVDKKEVVAVIGEHDADTMPIVAIKCPECKNKEAYFWTMQTRSGDEPETKFYKCTVCKHTWRDYL